ncbi:uncharacterized protein B0H18DRAFT_989747 [Fomitopsis serialis]|uniref:uncharacterized protein n=1 Tax=Fomitopsis serialis TaxID=139415 RepID=UPI00200806CD|nr:uncharacterized protein B0H18DRAFT_989747 [Neoantrodia serialis]KAH9931514.1 hypothetical protein B0H18DRAFT_989747 [Neoantrodia serialis]
MEEKRAKTLEALSEFIQSQKALLDQTRRDITALQELRESVVAHPDDSQKIFTEQVNTLTVPLSAQPNIAASVAQELDWDTFKSCDPLPFKILASSVRATQAERSKPSVKQTSELSDLQKLVKDARIAIIDPVLPSYAFLNEPDSEPDEPPDPEEIRRALEREKIHELKQRRISSDVAVPVVAGLRRPTQASFGVFIRRDQADESAEVDISLDAEDEEGERAPSVFDGMGAVPMEVDTPPTSVASPVSSKAILPPLVNKTSRDRRPATKAQDTTVSGPSTNSTHAKAKKRVQTKHKTEAGPDESTPAPAGVDEVPDAGKSLKKGKRKSETYKQSWSVDEQHLLERLLEEIPDGTKHRWAKISQAMDGRRTARQVASRVQKYFEKLKRFGVEVGTTNSGP